MWFIFSISSPSPLTPVSWVISLWYMRSCLGSVFFFSSFPNLEIQRTLVSNSCLLWVTALHGFHVSCPCFEVMPREMPRRPGAWSAGCLEGSEWASKVYVAVGLAPFSVRVLTAPRATFWPVSYRTMHDYNLIALDLQGHLVPRSQNTLIHWKVNTSWEC